MAIDVEGRMYNINGKELKLFPIGKISQALTDAGFPRSTQTIRKWEQTGIIPQAIFKIGKDNKRLYSIEQIELIVKVAEQCNIRQGAPIDSTDFSKILHEEWFILNRQYLT